MSSSLPLYHEINSGVSKFKGGGAAVYNVSGTITLAQLNAGLTLIEGQPGYSLKVVGYRLKVNGSFDDLTAAVIRSSDDATAIVSLAEAQMVDGALFSDRAAASGQTIGAGFAATLTAGLGVEVVKTGSTATAGTSIDYVIDFVVTK